MCEANVSGGDGGRSYPEPPEEMELSQICVLAELGRFGSMCCGAVFVCGGGFGLGELMLLIF